MPVISVRDNENNKWKRNAKKQKTTEKQNKNKKRKTKTERNKGAEAIVKGWELNSFVLRLS